MSDVPDEIWLDVLSRLPVVSLLRFRCVSKSWKCLIDSNEFITHHLIHSLKNPNSNLNIIIESFDLYSADFDLLNETNRVNFQELAHPLKAKLGKVRVLGSCHGLLVLSNDFFPTTILWNPSVRRFHELPYECLECGDVNFISHGFGYDAVSDDYKLVRMVVRLREDADTVVKVYSLKSDSWRRIPDLSYYLRYGSGVFVNGALHWNVRRRVNSDTATLVIAFNLGTEDFNLVPLPEFAVNNLCGGVFVLGGYLSFTIGDYRNIDIWVMKEYGVLESWSFLFTYNLSYGYICKWPIAYSECNREVLIGFDDGGLMWYNLDRKSTDVVEIPKVDTFAMCTCLQSLVLLNNGTRDFDLITSITERQDRKANKSNVETMQGRRNSYSSQWTWF